MTDRELYQATFAHLHASGSEIRQEAKHMKQGHIRKGVVIAAAAAAGPRFSALVKACLGRL